MTATTFRVFCAAAVMWSHPIVAAPELGPKPSNFGTIPEAALIAATSWGTLQKYVGSDLLFCPGTANGCWAIAVRWKVQDQSITFIDSNGDERLSLAKERGAVTFLNAQAFSRTDGGLQIPVGGGAIVWILSDASGQLRWEFFDGRKGRGKWTSWFEFRRPSADDGYDEEFIKLDRTLSQRYPALVLKASRSRQLAVAEQKRIAEESRIAAAESASGGGGGGGFGRALLGALAGFAGGAQGTGDMNGAIAGAIAGAAGGALGAEPEDVRGNVAQAASEESVRQRELASIVRAGLPKPSQASSSRTANAGDNTQDDPVKPSTQKAGVSTPVPTSKSIASQTTSERGFFKFFLQVPVDAPAHVIGNTICVSNIVSLPAPAGWPDNIAAAEQLAEGYFGRFLSACSRRAKPIGIDPPYINYKTFDRGGEIERAHQGMVSRRNNFQVEM